MTATGFAERLRGLREVRGLTREALSTAAGLHPGAVWEQEFERVVPTLATVEQLAAALGVTAGELAFGAAAGAAGPPLPTLGERLRRARTDADLSLRELAHRSKVSDTTLSRWERGLIQPEGVSLDKVFSVAQALRTSPAWLAFG